MAKINSCRNNATFTSLGCVIFKIGVFSRQLWWGHRIPAWYDAEGNVMSHVTKKKCGQKYNNLDSAVELKQMKAMLDTWFSSGLWTFSTLGWPEQTKEQMFHPTDVLITSFDIIFFWVARMIMFTMHFVKGETAKPQVPFKTVYVTSLIRDEQVKNVEIEGNVLDQSI